MNDSFLLYGIFGYPLGHTHSPPMQETAFKALGIKAFYLPFEVRPHEFRRVMRRKRNLILDGFNVTVPYKGEVVKYLRPNLTYEARAVKAVNTVYRKGKKWVGANTDVYGFLTSLQKDGRFRTKDKNVLILGAGGSARAAVYGLCKSGAREIRIAARRKSRVGSIIQDFRKLFSRTSFVPLTLQHGDLKRGLEDVHLVINATSVGVVFKTLQLIPDKLILRSQRGRRLLFFDFVYHEKTKFLKAASKKGHRTMDGVGMLLYQGAEAFRLWTGRKAPIHVMRTKLKENLDL